MLMEVLMHKDIQDILRKLNSDVVHTVTETARPSTLTPVPKGINSNLYFFTKPNPHSNKKTSKSSRSADRHTGSTVKTIKP